MMREPSLSEGLAAVGTLKSNQIERRPLQPIAVSESPSAWNCGELSSHDRRNRQQKQKDTRRRSGKADQGENRSLGGSDPVLRGTEAAQRLRRQGSLPPKVCQQFFSLRRQQT
jgi:hypothetical protein